jgi:hypothetical protein
MRSMEHTVLAPLRARVATALLVFAGASTVGCGHPAVGPTSFPAQYVAQGGTLDAVPACTQIQGLLVFDMRADKSVVGLRYRAIDRQRTNHPISMTGDMQAVLSSAVQPLFQSRALAISGESSAELRLGVVSIQIEEKAKRNSAYKISFVLDAQLVNRTNNQTVWQTRKNGQASNIGESGSALNYQETLSRGIEDAFNQLMRDPQFSQALCQSRVGPVTAS